MFRQIVQLLLLYRKAIFANNFSISSITITCSGQYNLHILRLSFICMQTSEMHTYMGKYGVYFVVVA